MSNRNIKLIPIKIIIVYKSFETILKEASYLPLNKSLNESANILELTLMNSKVIKRTIASKLLKALVLVSKLIKLFVIASILL